MNPPSKPSLSARYLPTRDGDLYVPEVVSPLPQRILPELPSNMQEGLARLELETGQSQNSIIWTGFEFTNQSIYHSFIDSYIKSQRTGPIMFNPFPKTQGLGPSIPLSVEEKGDLLEGVRSQILKSTDPEVQLAWAQDALLWVDIEKEYAIRMMSENNQPRSSTPKIQRELCEDAVNIVKHLGEQGHPKAEFIKAFWAEFGKFGHSMDKKESFLGYTRAAEKGFARAHYRIGMQYENSGNPLMAVEYYRRGVAMHDSASHYRLGMMTLLGQHGTPVDCVRGVNLLRFAAETADENSPQGAYVYGLLLERELPNVTIPEQILPFDKKEARKYIEKAAYLGFAKAQVKMGQVYELEQTEFDPALSLHYNALASRQGDADADMAISKWFLCGYEGLFEKNEKLAFTHAQRAAITELPMAEFAMGYFYEIGMHVKSDLCESERWYQKAAEHGNTEALERITSIKANNALSIKDHEQIAVKRIKSRFGSQCGERPDRFRKPPQPMPIVEGEQIDPPSTRSSYGGSSIPVRKDIIPPIVRPEMGEERNSFPGAVYAKNNGTKKPHVNSIGSRPFPHSNTIVKNRPVSMAPYPVDDSDDADFTLYDEGFHRVSDRPQSAFGIRPSLIHPKSDLSFHGQTPRIISEVRPLSSMGNTAPTHGGRTGSAGNRLVSSDWENQGRPYDYKPNGSAMNRLQKPVSSPNMHKPPVPHHSDDYRGRVPIKKTDPPLVPRRDPAANYPIRSERPERKSLSNSQAQAQQQLPNSNIPSKQNISSQHAPHKDSKIGNTRPLPSPPRLPSSTTAATSLPKKTGPVTFEEMGIPAANKQGECSVM